MYMGRSRNSLRHYDDEFIDGSKLTSYRVPVRRRKAYAFVIVCSITSVLALAGLIYVIVVNITPTKYSSTSSSITDGQNGNSSVDGGFGDWGEWGLCSVTCGGGGRHRNRSCNNPVPGNGGKGCQGPETETKTCNFVPCAVHGGFSSWADWTECSATCDGGIRTRDRQCNSPLPSNGGDNCVGDFSETEICSDLPCPVDGGYTDWTSWEPCSVTCGDGQRSRQRSCENPAPVGTGNTCMGQEVMTEMCGGTLCPVDGEYGMWTVWDQCSATCGGGRRYRYRACDSPIPANGGMGCSGLPYEVESCNNMNCPVNGGFGPWTSWELCSVTCGGGERTRTRSCDSPAPAYGGMTCLGDYSHREICNFQACPVDGGLSDWSVWDTCTVTCGGGQNTRTRSCSNPPPANGGQDCTGELSQTEDCNTIFCPVGPIDGGLSDWSDWDTCSMTCSGGQRTRTRSCDNPPPANGGQSCTGDLSQTEACNNQLCPVDGGLSNWSVWGTCSMTCGGGQKSRTRSCDNPSPANGGQNCMGDLSQTEACNSQLCPVDGGLGAWSVWDSCSVTCGDGERTRSRSCDNPSPANGGRDCIENLSQTENCNIQPCPVDGGLTPWSTWDMCSATCEGGVRSRTRTCDNPSPANGGRDCTGDLSQTEACNTFVCPVGPVDGGLSDWSVWGMCSVTCGGGQKSRTRSCDNPPPANGGQECTGNLTQTESCKTQLCPVDGGLSIWSVWGTCSATCGGGQRSRTRSCDNPPPANGGQNCTGDLSETEACNTSACPVDGGLSNWSVWGTCSVTCGGGQRSRTRSCDNPPPANGGQDCTGNLTQTEACNNQQCPVDGGLSDWSVWGTCSVTCGGGQRSRTRSCDKPPPANGGQDCIGDLSQTEACNSQLCPVNGGLSEWSVWGTCSVTCGSGQRSRTRSCDNPAPANGGQNCTGNFSQTETCNSESCPVDGGLSDWSAWGTCSLTCGGGQRSRTRSCDNPPPANGGQNCTGDLSQTEACNSQICPVDGGLSDWSAWDTCSVTCGGGQKSRARSCDNPPPANGGQDCTGNLTQTEACNNQLCPVDGGLSDWSAWDTCSVTCGSGQRSRARSCDNPPPANGGQDCTGNLTQTEACNNQLCPVDGGLSDWSAWDTCSVTCGSGQRSRARSCDNPPPANGGQDCTGNLTQTEACNNQLCPVDGGLSDWSAWGTCSVTCGGGQRSRARSCDNPPPANGGQDCTGNLTQREACNNQLCPVDGGLSDWSAWGTCSVTCGGGQRSRARSCDNPPPANGGQDCTGNLTQTEACNNQLCPVDGGLSDWSAWGTCSVTCGGGQRSRTRSCDNPPPANGGQDCTGNLTQTETCNNQLCPVNGGLSDWSAWGTCTVTCGDGQRSRTRSCDNPPPANGGQNCTGNLTETEACNSQSCPVDGGLSDWSAWGSCSVTCDGGLRSRTRSCDNPTPANGGQNCTEDLSQTEACGTSECPNPCGFSPTLTDLQPVDSLSTDDMIYYGCTNSSLSIDIKSGSTQCPVTTCWAGNSWSPVTATCGKGRVYGNEQAGIGGTVVATSGIIRSPLYPQPYPDVSARYYWTLLTGGTSINFNFTSMDLVGEAPFCFISVSIFCGINIAWQTASYGPFCGSDIPASVSCASSCAQVTFFSVPQGSSGNGFELMWSST